MAFTSRTVSGLKSISETHLSSYRVGLREASIESGPNFGPIPHAFYGHRGRSWCAFVIRSLVYAQKVIKYEQLPVLDGHGLARVHMATLHAFHLHNFTPRASIAGLIFSSRAPRTRKQHPAAQGTRVSAKVPIGFEN